MKKNPPNRSEPVEEIEPIPFQPPSQSRRPNRRPVLKWLFAGAVLVLLLAALWFVFTARRVTVEITPVPDRIAIQGGLAAPGIHAGYLLRPGAYTLIAEKTCYFPLRHAFTVTDAPVQTIAAAMVSRPGSLTVEIHSPGPPQRPLTGLRIYVDGVALDSAAMPLAIQAGSRRLRIKADRHQDYVAGITVEGCGVLQTHRADLLPDWSTVTVRSQPAGATVTVDGQAMGQTPATLELTAGTHELELQHSGYQTWRTQLAVEANQPQQLEEVILQPADGRLRLTSTPAGATVLVGTRYAGRTPLTIHLASGIAHTIRLSKTGYQTAQRQVTLKPEADQRISIPLTAQQGVVRFAVEPADAVLVVNGRKIGRPPARMRLPAAEQRIEITKIGYQSYRTRITPRPGFDQEVRIALKRTGAATPNPEGLLAAANGYTLKLIRPQAFTMGSSRRQQGRRPNETLRQIDLKRPFYMGIHEVTNAQFQQFQSDHRSGSVKGQRLNAPQQPVVRVTWQQAALFCNWMSAQESLPPVYVPSDQGMVVADPTGPGYRLPTEAEWEYCARYRDNRPAAKYPWGDRYPPPERAGNFADQSARDLLATPLKDYNDGYPVTAPPGRFAPNPLGIFDMGGNVAEWCQDYYAIYSHQPGRLEVDPRGPAEGRHHVVRGSSYRHAGIAELRSAYRDYSDDKRDDLGFRVVRYASETGGGQ